MSSSVMSKAASRWRRRSAANGGRVRHRGCRNVGLQVLAIAVEIPERAPRHVGVVRMREADRQAPGAVVLAPREIVELLRGEGDLVVVFHLVGDLGHARAGDASPCCDTTSRSARRVCGSRASSRNRRGRCRWSAAPRTRAAGRGRRNASCPTGRSGSPRGAGDGRRSGCRRRIRRRCRRPACARQAGPDMKLARPGAQRGEAV
jgi:hypothetical protein